MVEFCLCGALNMRIQNNPNHNDGLVDSASMEIYIYFEVGLDRKHGK